MNNRMDGERYLSTASTVSGIYSHILPSPAPVCMFYFAHPFGGIATPSSTSYSIDPYAGMPTAPNSSHNKYPPNNAIQQHLNDFTPWPKETWQPRDILTPLIKALQQQIEEQWEKELDNELQEFKLVDNGASEAAQSDDWEKDADNLLADDDDDIDEEDLK